MDARARILSEARERIASGGWDAARSGAIAGKAGVSKALIHYHFSDKTALLVAVAESCRANITGRDIEAPRAARGGAAPVDAFVRWMTGELQALDVRIALQLTSAEDSRVRSEAAEALEVFRASLSRRVTAVFDAVGLTPRISMAVIVDSFAAASYGLAARGGEAQQVLESLWLSMLTLGD